eukprot:SM000002S05519  [mRNA]  locus=s2:342643:351603:- [translate_table: standard]
MGVWEDAVLGAPPTEFLKVAALPKRFAALAFRRRIVEDQIAHNKAVSGNALNKNLGWFSFACMAVGNIIATGIFSFMPYIYSSITGPAVVLSLLVASAAAAFSAFIYSEFAVEYPVVGGGFVYTLNTFGEFPAVLCATNLVIDYVFGNAAVTRNFSVYFSQLINQNDDHIFQRPVSFQHDPVDWLALLIIIFLTTALCISNKAADESNMVLQFAHVGLVVFTFTAAFTKADTANWTPFFPKSLGPPSGARTIVTGASNIFFVFVGYDVVALGAEEAKNDWSVPLGMLSAVIFVTIIYVLMASSLVMLIPFAVLSAQPSDVALSGFAYAFTVRGLEWAKYIVAAGACIGIFTSSGVGLYGLSRVFQVFGREALFPKFFGRVNSWSHTPVYSIILAGAICGVISFFTAFNTLANMTSIGTLTMYWFVAVAHIYRRYAPEFEPPEKHMDRHLAIKFRPDVFGRFSVTIRRIIVLFYIFMITMSIVGFTIYWNLSGGTVWLYICIGSWAFWTVLLWLTMPINYVPAKFHVPAFCMPWIPSCSIFANVMLIGGFGAHKSDYIRLFVAMGIGAVIYILFGVHNSYYRFYGPKAAEKRDYEMKEAAAAGYDAPTGAYAMPGTTTAAIDCDHTAAAAASPAARRRRQWRRHMAAAPAADDASLLLLLLDVHAAFWRAQEAAAAPLRFPAFVEQLLAFVNAYLLLHHGNRLVVIAAGAGCCRVLYETPAPTSAAVAQEARAAPGPEPVSPAGGGAVPPSQAIVDALAAFAADGQRQAAPEASDVSLLSGTLHPQAPPVATAAPAAPGESRQSAAASAGTVGEGLPLLLQHALAQGWPRRTWVVAAAPPVQVLCLQGSPDPPQQYIAIMNTIFSAKNSAVPIDACMLGGRDSAYLQQAAHLTAGLYLKLSQSDALLQYLLMIFATDLYSRRFLQLPRQEGVDFRASCFCHKKTIDLGFVCSVCLSIFCKQSKSCSTCGATFSSSRQLGSQGSNQKAP